MYTYIQSQLTQGSTLVLSTLLAIVLITGCDNPAEPEPAKNQPDGSVLHISPHGHTSEYAGEITYTHGNMVEGSFSRTTRVVPDTMDAPTNLHISGDLTISTGASGTFTVSVDRAPKYEQTIVFSVESDDFDVTPPLAFEFTADDYAPHVLTVKHTGNEATKGTITFTHYEEVGHDVSMRSLTREITVIDGHAVPEVSVSGNLAIHPGGTGLITISLDKAPGAEVVQIDLDALPGPNDSLRVTPKPVLSFTQSNWSPRVLLLEHVGLDAGEQASLGIKTKGSVRNAIRLTLTHQDRQATLAGFEVIGVAEVNFEASGVIGDKGRYTASELPFITPFASSCGIESTHDSRVQFREKSMTILQSFSTNSCANLKVYAGLNQQ